MKRSRFLALLFVPSLACSSASSNTQGSPDGGTGASGAGSGQGSGSGRGSGSGSGSAVSGTGSGSGSAGGSGSGSGSGTGTGAGAGSVPFQALHTYYLSPTGSDSNSGTSTSSAWATPNHPLLCGDVVLAEPGTYSTSQFVDNWGVVSSCPSTTAGIDGKGGVYFATLLCAGPDLTSCTVDGGAKEAFRVSSSNWSIEGFSATQAPTASEGGYAVGCYTATSETSTTLHHVAFINDIASGCDAAGFGSYSHTSPGGVDQTAVVGVIAYNAAPSQGGGGICGSGISIIPANGPDTSPGTHVFVAGAFSYRNVNAATGEGCNTDGEGLIFDSWGIPQYSHQAVAEQNVFWANGGPGFEAFPQGNGTSDDQATIIVLNNTSYGNFQDPKHGGSGELLLNGVYPTTGSYTFTNNVFEATQGSSAGATVYAAAIDCKNGCPSSVVSIDKNHFWNSHAPTTTAPGGDNTQAYYSGAGQGASFPWGTNTFTTPGFASPSALPSGAPDCAGHATTTACMTAAGVPAALAPSGGAASVGYSPPTACQADAYYPTWLKGVVYLSASGSNLTENGGLITKPCDM